jgi:hypothetical protein
MTTDTTSARRKPSPFGSWCDRARFRCTTLCAMSRRRGGARHLLQKQRYGHSLALLSVVDWRLRRLYVVPTTAQQALQLAGEESGRRGRRHSS